jgi:hypothetical protein
LISELAEAGGKTSEDIESVIDSALAESMKGMKAKVEH